MGYRKFVDRDGEAWEIRDRTRSEWQFHPVGGNPASSYDVQAPGHESDPFDVSHEELQRMLDAVHVPGHSTRTARKSPFLDD